MILVDDRDLIMHKLLRFQRSIHSKFTNQSSVMRASTRSSPGSLSSQQRPRSRSTTQSILRNFRLISSSRAKRSAASTDRRHDLIAEIIDQKQVYRSLPSQYWVARMRVENYRLGSESIFNTTNNTNQPLGNHQQQQENALNQLNVLDVTNAVGLESNNLK